MLSSFRPSHAQPSYPSRTSQSSIYPQLPIPSQPFQQNFQPTYGHTAQAPSHPPAQTLPGTSQPHYGAVQPYFQPQAAQQPSRNPYGPSHTHQDPGHGQAQGFGQIARHGPGGGPSGGPVQGYYAPTGPQTALQPQQLEIVSRDEDPMYGPLGRARGKVERAMTGDNEISPDLADLLQAPNNEPYAALPGPSFRPIRISRTLPLPDALHQELNYKHLSAKMGLFEEIERAWFTVDNRLFLWNYTDGRDFSRYDEQNDTIQSVGLVKARKDVFVDDITHILIICTASRATLLGLTSPNPRELNLFATNLSTDTPTAMLSITGTATGRVFLLGANKDLYELEYSADSSWFFGSSTRVALLNRSRGTFSNWVPTVFSSSSKEGVESFVVDSAQARLFALHTKGEIEYFDVAGSNFVSRGKYTRLKSDLVSRGMAGQGPEYAGAKVVSIAVIGAHESRRACLVAVTANGTRIYFALSFAFSPILFRPPPTGDLHLTSQTLYSSGSLIGVQSGTSAPGPSSRLNCIIPHSGRQSAARENYENFEPPALQEWAVSETIPSQVWTIVEAPKTSPANASAGLRRTDGLALSPLPRQATTDAREFLVLATSGLFFLSQSRPIDSLRSDAEIEKDSAINAVRHTFGKNQLAAMGIMLGSTADLSQAETASTVSTIMLSAGAPTIRDSTAGKIVTYSPRHEGLAMMIARVLRFTWSVSVTVPVSGGRQILGVTEGALLAVQKRLEGLHHYVDENPFPRQPAEGDVKLAWDQEELSLHSLGLLLRQAIEAISFILLLSDYKLSDVVARCEPQVQQALNSLTFQALFTSTDGRDLARKLVAALIEQQIGQALGIDTLSEILQQRCGTFCQPGDVVMYKAEENIRRAESARDPADRSHGLTESLRKAAGSIPVARLQDVSRRYRAMQYTLGAIELPLKCATDVDPNDRALDFVRDGQHPSDPRKSLYTARMECYQLVIEALATFDEALDKATAHRNAATATAKRDEAYTLAIASDDELFHFYLYDWHVSRHLSEQLLEFDTPYIERYLQMTSSSVEERRDLLWKFYSRREEYLPASKALYDLATRQSAMTLLDRVYYLAQALTSAKSAASLGSEDVEFMSSLQERMDVANVQMEVVRGLEAVSGVGEAEKEEAMRRSNGDLLGLDELYQDFARPFRLYEPILLILKTADTRIDDVLDAVWRQLLRQSVADGMQSGVAEAVMADLVRDLCRKYFPSEAAPLDIVLPAVYTEASPVSGEAGWASTALLDGGIPLRDLWEGVMSLYEEDGGKEFYAEEAGALAQRWMTERERIPAAEVERFASAYLLRTQSDGFDDRRKAATRERFASAKALATRY